MSSSPSSSQPPPPLLRPGRILLTLVALMTSTACFVADWNESHIYNHTWPGHAKFHNGQTMSMGLLLGVAALFYLYRAPLLVARSGSGSGSGSGSKGDAAAVAASVVQDADAAAAAAASKGEGEGESQSNKTTTTNDALVVARLRAASAHRDLGTAVLLNSLYWITQLSAHWYPQVTAFDPVPGSSRFGEHVHQDPHLQKKLDLSMFFVTGVGWWLESRRIARGEF